MWPIFIFNKSPPYMYVYVSIIVPNAHQMSKKISEIHYLFDPQQLKF